MIYKEVIIVITSKGAMQRNRLMHDTLQYKLRTMSEPELLGARAVLDVLSHYLRHPFFNKRGEEVDGYGIQGTLCRLYHLSGDILHDVYHRDVYS